MRIAPITNNYSYITNTTVSKRKNMTPSFGEVSGHDFFVEDVGFNILQTEPENFLKKIKPNFQEKDSTLYFKEAVRLKAKEELKPDTTKEMENAVRKHYQASCLESASTDMVDESARKKLAKLASESKKDAVNEYAQLQIANRDDEKIKAYSKIIKKMMKSKGFDPNYTDKNVLGKSLVEYVIDKGDDELATAIIKHKKFVKPEKFIDSSAADKYNELADKAKSWTNFFHRH